jgi:hypothetical protein
MAACSGAADVAEQLSTLHSTGNGLCYLPRTLHDHGMRREQDPVLHVSTERVHHFIVQFREYHVELLPHHNQHGSHTDLLYMGR